MKRKLISLFLLTALLVTLAVPTFAGHYDVEVDAPAPCSEGHTQNHIYVKGVSADGQYVYVDIYQYSTGTFSPSHDLSIGRFVDSDVEVGAWYWSVPNMGNKNLTKCPGTHSNHTHSFTYSADGATLTATCSATGCDLTDSKVSLTLSASNANYSGSAYTGASLSDTTAWEDAELAIPTINYVGSGSTTYPESATAPTNSGTYTATITADSATAVKNFEIIAPHIHSYSNWTPVDKTSHTGTCECGDTTTVGHNWVRSADGSTTSCETCGAYVTVKAESGVLPKTVKDCVKVKTNLPTTPNLIVMDTSKTPAKEVALTTSAEGNYQAVAFVKAGVNPYADFTLTNPKTTAATGDNRPIELLVFGFAAMSLMAAAAFTVDRKRR